MTLKNADDEQVRQPETTPTEAKAVPQTVQSPGENKQNHLKWYVVVATTASLTPQICHALAAVADTVNHFIKMFT